MMNRTSVIIASASILQLAACSGTVVSEGSGGIGGSGSSSTSSTSSSSTSSSGTSSNSSSSSSSSGTGGATSSSTSSSSASGAGTGGGACTGFVDVDVASGLHLHLTSDCASDAWNPTNATTPVGYLLEGGIGPGMSTLYAYACQSEAASSEGIVLTVPSVTAPGKFAISNLTYTDAQGTAWSGGSQVSITKLGAAGDTIEGTLSAWVSAPPADVAMPVTGSFTLCHLQDELVP